MINKAATEATLRYQSELINQLRREKKELKQENAELKRECEKLREIIKDYQAIQMVNVRGGTTK